MSRQLDKFGNYSIPVSLSDELIDSLDKELFENPSHKFCYATIVDDYLISKLIDKLMIGLSNDILNEAKRYNHIINNMIYCIAINDISYLTIKKLFPDLKNIFLKDISKDDISDMPKFDFIIQNPPYNRTTHIDFFDKALDLLSSKGQMIIIEPATWLMLFRETRNSKKYNELKNKIHDNIKFVKIENYNREFGIGLYTPISITHIDFSKKYNCINFDLAGLKSNVLSIYDCNHIGDINIIKSIFNKIKLYNDFAEKHSLDNIIPNKNSYFTTYTYLFQNLSKPHGKNADPFIEYHKDCIYRSMLNNMYEFHVTYSCMGDGIYEKQPFKKGPGGKITDKLNNYCLVGKKDEITNYRNFCNNNSLPLFINIVMTIDCNNNSLPYIPWIVDKQYTDEEIYKLFKFSNEEIKLIEYTIKKFSRYSPWFKRYMTGDTSIEINQEKPWLPIEEN